MRLFAATVGAILLLSSILFCQDQTSATGCVKVTVVDANGKVLEGVKLELKQRHGPYRSSALSDSAGVTLFQQVPIGHYDVVGKKKNFHVADLKDAEVFLGRTSTLRVGMVPDDYWKNPNIVY